MKQILFQITVILLIFGCSTNNNGTVTVVPLTPTNLTGTVISTSQINLTWTDNATNEDGYKIERKTAGGNYAVVGSTASNMTSFNDLGLTPNTSYTYRVYAYNSAGNSLQYSNEVTISTQDSIPSWLTNGLVGYWPFNGNANDESGNGNNGTVNGATLTSDRFGNSNKAFFFNGSSDINITTNGIINGNSSATLCGWFYESNTSSHVSYIVSFGSESNLGSSFSMGEYGPNGMFSTFWGSQYDAISNMICPLNGWHFMTATHTTNGSITLYLDGNVIYTNTVSPPNLMNSLGKIGRAVWTSSNEYWNGSLDDIRIYNRALSASEVAYLAAH